MVSGANFDVFNENTRIYPKNTEYIIKYTRRGK